MSYTELVQVVDPEGRAKDESALKGISYDQVYKMYRLMVFTRSWNAKALSLQRQGRMGTLASVRGQEASNVGMGLALGPDDWFCPAFREYGAMFARGIDPLDLYSVPGAVMNAEDARQPVAAYCRCASRWAPICFTR